MRRAMALCQIRIDSLVTDAERDEPLYVLLADECPSKVRHSRNGELLSTKPLRLRKKRKRETTG